MWSWLSVVIIAVVVAVVIVVDVAVVVIVVVIVVVVNVVVVVAVVVVDGCEKSGPCDTWRVCNGQMSQLWGEEQNVHEINIRKSTAIKDGDSGQCSKQKLHDLLHGGVKRVGGSSVVVGGLKWSGVQVSAVECGVCVGPVVAIDDQFRCSRRKRMHEGHQPLH